MKFNAFTRVVALSAMVCSVSFAAEGRMTAFEAAKKKAVTEKKPLLLEFTGSDWCPPCKMLNQQVFSKPEFKGGEKFVLVKLDFPRDKSKVDEATQKQNAMLQEKYGITGYPTILLVDEKGLPFAKTGFRPGGAEAYNKHLDELFAKKATRDAAFAAADALEDKKAAAQKKSEALQAMEGVNVAAAYPEVVEFIKQHDPENLWIVEESLKKDVRSNKDKEKVAGLMKRVDDLIAAKKLEGEELQQMLTMKLDACFACKMFKEMGPTLDKIVEIDATTRIGQGVKAFRDGRYQQMIKPAEKK